MGDDGGFGCIAVPVAAIILFCACVTLYANGINAGARIEQTKAIAANVGRWTVDAKTGEQAFVYGVAKEDSQ